LASEEAQPDNAKLKKYLTRIIKGGHRARNVVKQILDFSRQETTVHVALALTPLVKECIKLLESVIPKNITIETHLNTTDDTILADPTQIHQVIINLGTNAYQAMRTDGGSLTVMLENIRLAHPRSRLGLNIEAGSYVKLSVTDTGTGIPAHVLDRIFDPYYTTKEIHEGTGFGLSVSFGIVKSHCGLIEVEETSEAGTTFAVFFQVSDKHMQLSADDSQKLMSGSNEHILVVDDEPFFLDVLRENLTALSYRVTVFQRSTEALDRLHAEPDAFDVILTDQTMPEMTGVQLAAEAKKINPHIPIILYTGYNETVTEETAANFGITKFLLKPINRQELAQAVRDVLQTTEE